MRLVKLENQWINPEMVLFVAPWAIGDYQSTIYFSVQDTDGGQRRFEVDMSADEVARKLMDIEGGGVGVVPPSCDKHVEVQHRDGKPPWCNNCGWRRAVPARPAEKLGTPRSERVSPSDSV